MEQTSYSLLHRAPQAGASSGQGDVPCTIAIDDAIQRYLTFRAMKGGTVQSLCDLRRYLNDFAKWAVLLHVEDLAGLNPDLLKKYQCFLFEYRKRDGQPLATASKLAKLVPLRGWLRWLTTLGVAANLVDAIELPAADQALPRRLLSAAEIEAVMAMPRTDTPLGLRDRAMLELLYATGIRRMEIGQLDINDVDLSRAILCVRNGKGRKDRRIPMGPRAQHWLVTYLEQGRPALSGASSSLALFPGREGPRLNINWLSTVISGYVRRSGVGRAGACHLFRHSMATLMLDGGADIRYIQAMLGHAQLSTTQIYTHVSTARLEQVYLATHPGAKGYGAGGSVEGVRVESREQEDELSVWVA
ncbi:tyrosine-type recombinase/integrase [Ramlibacter sp. G-1-2-2]|uniref:Tyrosine-type recombinase/integrase n=1 Tax=Ramlibacter agri TaxID=2728837 RepID=A0A848HH72_9BURK|nr:tyrosine-type recombinase/integrase [Ramlibacter agri]NML47873.1 tyrosine-type recombinase/integrase [Ramlibacter agri]